jgi:aarF domain-containing kinase
MRGAALKLGQMLSVQEDGMLSPALQKALARVKQSADYMPKRQLEAQMTSQLGAEWRGKFLEFDDIPIGRPSSPVLRSIKRSAYLNEIYT